MYLITSDKKVAGFLTKIFRQYDDGIPTKELREKYRKRFKISLIMISEDHAKKIAGYSENMTEYKIKDGKIYPSL